MDIIRGEVKNIGDDIGELDVIGDSIGQVHIIREGSAIVYFILIAYYNCIIQGDYFICPLLKLE